MVALTHKANPVATPASVNHLRALGRATARGDPNKGQDPDAGACRATSPIPPTTSPSTETAPNTR